MNSIYILATLHGEQDSQFALLTFDHHAVAAIIDGQRAAKRFHEDHGGSPSIRHTSGNYRIDFLKDIPEEFEEFAHSDDARQDPILIDSPDFCFSDFMDNAEVTNSVIPSESEGLLIWRECVRIIGYEKHCSDLLDSHDILPAILKKYPDFPIVFPS